MSKHIQLPAEAEQKIPVPATAPVGTFFDLDTLVGSMEGRMGDVIEVDLRKAIADAIARELMGLPNSEELSEAQMTADQLLGLQEARTYAEREDITSGFQLDIGVIARLIQETAELRLITEPKSHIKDSVPLSRAGTDNLAEADFGKTGRLYLVPNITAANETSLRNGDRLNDKTTVITFHFRFKNAGGEWEWRQGSVSVTARDIPQVNTFFGDRPLDNPGYSALKLAGEVSVASQQAKTIDVLDVYKVEQRLRYLGFPAMKTAPLLSNTPLNFDVDGIFGGNETNALKLFEKVVNYSYTGVASKFDPTTDAANGKILNPNTLNSFGNRTVAWLNAWNAPHWINVGQYAQRLNSNFINSQDNSGNDRRENYGASWLGDLLVAQQYSALAANIPYSILFNGAVDANLATTQAQHKSHDLGMAFDIGIRPRLVSNVPVDAPIATNISERNIASDRMAQLSNPAGFVPNQWSDSAAEFFVQRDLRAAYQVQGEPNLITVRNNTIADPDGNFRLPTGNSWGAVGAASGQINDQRAVTAEILSLYSITNRQSTGFTAATGRLAGTVAEQDSKSTGLFESLWSMVFIGDATNVTPPHTIGQLKNTYENINEILGRLGPDSVTSPELFPVSLLKSTS